MSDADRLASATGRPRISGLDALRGIAALGVVFHHYTWRFHGLYPGRPLPSLQFSGGLYCVDLFFMISGYVIFMSLTRSHRPMDFVVSRSSRLYPAYWAAVFLTFVLVHLATLPGREVSPSDGAMNLTMLQSFVGRPAVDGVYWTLAVELAFYVIVFGLYWGGMLSPRRLPWTLGSWLAIAVAWRVFVALGPHVPGLSYVGVRLLILPYVQFFVVGMCLFEIHRRGRADRLLVLLIVAAPFVQSIEAMPVSPVQSFIVTSLLAGLFIAVVEGKLGWLATRPFLELGAISYTLYLVHQNLGYVMLRWFDTQHLDPDIAVFLALLAALAIAVLITRLIEQPAMRLIRGWYREREEARRVRVDRVLLPDPLRRELLVYMRATSDGRAAIVARVSQRSSSMADLLMDLDADEELRTGLEMELLEDTR